MRSAILLMTVLCCGCAARIAPMATVPASEGGEAKVVQHGQIITIVEDFAKFEQGLEAKVRAAGGKVSAYTENSASPQARGGQWTVRIPVAKFEATCDDIAALGHTTQRQMTSEDVTSQYVDLEARLKNEKRLEERLLDIIDKKAGDLKDVLAIETELSRVRQEIERLEGQRRVLADKTALSTLTIFVSEQPGYSPIVATTFVGRIANTFWQSLRLLALAVETLVIVFIFLIPWFVAGCVLLSMLWMLVKLLFRRRVRAA